MFKHVLSAVVMVGFMGFLVNGNVAKAQSPAVTWWEDQVSSQNILVQAPAGSLDPGYVYAFEGYMGFQNGVYQYIYTGNLYMESPNPLISPASHVGRFWTPYHLHKVIVRFASTVYFTPRAAVSMRRRLPNGTYSSSQSLQTGRRYSFAFAASAPDQWIELTDVNGRVTLIHFLPF